LAYTATAAGSGFLSFSGASGDGKKTPPRGKLGKTIQGDKHRGVSLRFSSSVAGGMGRQGLRKMTESTKLAAILAADVVGFSRLAGADEERTLTRLRALRSDLIDPTIAVHRGRVVKRTGDGTIVEFRSVVDAVRCAIEVQNAMVERNAGLPNDRQIEFRIGIHLGDVVEESDGDLMGDGVNIAARLEGVAKPGAICLSEDAYRQVKARLDVAVTDLDETELKNIAEAVRVYSLEVGQPGRPKAPPAPAHEKPAPPRLSIVVLPFANIGGGTEQDYFVDGVTESLTTDLSRISGAFVIGRNTAFTYKGKAVDLKQIGRDLNVRYVLEGSVQRGGNRMRVNVQLIEAETGAHLWAERFDKPIADLFEMQDEIVSRLATRLEQELMSAEAKRAERSANPDSMDHYFLGLAAFNRGQKADILATARAHFERALEIDPGNVDALVMRGLADLAVVAAWLSDNRDARLRSAEADLLKALKLRPDHAFAHAAFGMVCLYTKRFERGVSECERALAIDRNLTAAHYVIGLAKYLMGRNEETEAHVLEASRLSPRDRYAGAWLQIAGFAKLGAGFDEEAIGWLRRSIEGNHNVAISHFLSAAALARLGRLEAARRVASRAGTQPELHHRAVSIPGVQR
jgi:TolB-like protein/class 3 adenylate cyclase